MQSYINAFSIRNLSWTHYVWQMTLHFWLLTNSVFFWNFLLHREKKVFVPIFHFILKYTESHSLIILGIFLKYYWILPFKKIFSQYTSISTRINSVINMTFIYDYVYNLTLLLRVRFYQMVSWYSIQKIKEKGANSKSKQWMRMQNYTIKIF